MSTIDHVLDGLRPEPIEAHLRFLSNTLLEGRGVGSRGGRIAEEYIRAVLAAAGCQPLPDGDFRQVVPMIALRPKTELAFTLPAGGSLAPRYAEEYVLAAGIREREVTVEAPLAFAGFGITAPEFGWNDYGDADVTGKVLLIRVNDPGTPDTPDFFEGRALTYYGRWTYKFEEASRRGAAGVLLIHTDDSAGYGWNVVRTSNTGEQYDLAGSPEFPLGIRGWLMESTARRLLDAAGGADSLLAESGSADFRVRDTGVTVRASVRTEVREVTTANVIGILPGSKPARSAEPVILMAHHDHLGMTEGEGGPVIYPGARDNASGVALLLAMAEALAVSGYRPARPIVFLGSTAEEFGLLGSEWYTRHAPFPLGRTAAVLNVDGANLNGPTDDIAPLGVDRSSLGEFVRAAADAEGMVVSPEQHPEKGSFFRQDHFPFARAGVPGIAFDHGLRYRERPEGWGERWYENFVAHHYHQPSDAFSDDFDYRGAVQQGRVMLRAAVAIADSEILPDWHEGSPFKRR